MVQLKELQEEQVRVLSATMVEPEVQRAPVAESTEGEEWEGEGKTGESGTLDVETENKNALIREKSDGAKLAEAEAHAESEERAPKAAAEDEEMLSLD